jgi:hypothetical protein
MQIGCKMPEPPHPQKPTGKKLFLVILLTFAAIVLCGAIALEIGSVSYKNKKEFVPLVEQIFGKKY